MGKNILDLKNIKSNLLSVSKTEAIKAVGQTLVDNGYAQKEYIPSILNREKHVTTYIGNHIAIPHGEAGSEKYILHTGIAIHHYPEGVEFDSEKAYFIVGIAANDTEHLEILANIAEKFSDIDVVNELIKSKITDKKLYKIFNIKVED